MVKKDFAIAVMINGISAPEYHYKGSAFIESVKETEFSILIVNLTRHKTIAIVRIDDLPVINKKDGGFIIEPYSFIKLLGWYLNGKEAGNFIFHSLPKFYAVQMSRLQQYTGIIEAAFYFEKENSPTEILSIKYATAEELKKIGVTPYRGQEVVTNYFHWLESNKGGIKI